MAANPQPALNSENEFCTSCGNWVYQLNTITGFCDDCTNRLPGVNVEKWLAEHVEHIEHYERLGLSTYQAIVRVRADLKPICLSCGAVIKRAPRNAIFCRVNPVCRRYSRKYVYYYQEKEMSKAEALAKILNEIETGRS